MMNSFCQIERVVYTLLLLLTLLPAAATCPANCLCNSNGATCLNVVELPNTLPHTLVKLKLLFGNLYSIPPNYFKQFKYLKMLEINACNINVIPSCAFADLINLQELKITKCVIDVIEDQAFSHIHNLTFEISDSKIRAINSYAFADLQIFSWGWIGVNVSEVLSTHAMHDVMVENLTFRDNLFENIQTNAFAKLKNSKLRLNNNTFHKLECNSAETLVENTTLTIITNNKFVCGCNISWLASYQNLTDERLLHDNNCYPPSSATKAANLRSIYELHEKCSNYTEKCLSPTTHHPRKECSLLKTKSNLDDPGSTDLTKPGKKGPRGTSSIIYWNKLSLLLLILLSQL